MATLVYDVFEGLSYRSALSGKVASVVGFTLYAANSARINLEHCLSVRNPPHSPFEKGGRHDWQRVVGADREFLPLPFPERGGECVELQEVSSS